MNRSIELIPFFERSGRDQDDWPGESYVGGFRKADGRHASVQVVLPAELVEHAVLADSRLSLSMNPDGTFALHSEGLSDEALDAASQCCLGKQSLQSLLKDCLQPDLVAMEDDPAVELSALRSQLATGLDLIDRTLEQLRKKK